MRVELSPSAAKYLKGLDTPIENRIKKALYKLSLNPPQGDIKALVGKDGYRLRIGGYRILFDKVDNKILVHDIGIRGQIYKGR